MIDAPAAEARFWAAVGELDAAQPDEYFYRVDSHHSVRTIRRHPVLRPRRWGAKDRFPHEELIEADRSKQRGQAVFRLSFWRTLAPAVTDWKHRSSQHAMILMRVRRSVVRQMLVGWTFTDDDHLQNAELIWKVGTVEEDLNDFYTGGVPLDQVEVLDSNAVRWSGWHDSAATVPDRVRVPAIGWSPIAIHTRQGPGMAYWAAVPEPGSPAHEPVFWCLLTLDEETPGTLGSEDLAITRVMTYLLLGPLRELALCRVSVLTLSPAPDRVWAEQFDISWSPGKARWPSWLRPDPEPMLHIERCAHLRPEGMADLVAASRLPDARPEFNPSIWTWDWAR
jgi:hypothetical protein